MIRQAMAPFDMPGSVQRIAVIAWRFALNVLTAVLGTGVIESPFERFFGPSRAAVLRADFFNAAIAFGLGYFAFRRWHTPAKWVWVAGLGWFLLGAIYLADVNAMFWELSRNAQAFDLRNNSDGFRSVNSFYNWTGFTLPLVRTTFYSLGAVVSQSMAFRYRS